MWASEIGIPGDPVKAALTLVNSESRKVDVGHVELESLTFPETIHRKMESNLQIIQKREGSAEEGEADKESTSPFLLMSGLGIDAAVMGHVSKPLKYKIGPLAVGLSAAKELPAHHPFPIEIRAEGCWT